MAGVYDTQVSFITCAAEMQEFNYFFRGFYSEFFDFAGIGRGGGASPCRGRVFRCGQGGEVEVLVGAKQGVEAARVGGISVENFADFIFVEDAETGLFGAAIGDFVIVVNLFRGELRFR